MKSAINIFFSVAIILMFSFPAIAWSDAASAHAKKDSTTQDTDLRLLLNTFAAFAEEHIEGVLRGLNILSVTEEIESGEWDDMKGLLTEFSKSGITPAAVWFARPDGSYYTLEKGLTDQNLVTGPISPNSWQGNNVAGEPCYQQIRG